MQLSLEQAWMGYQTDVGTGLNGASLIAGRMNALFSPEINRHASSSAFSAPRLLDNSLYGVILTTRAFEVRSLRATGNWARSFGKASRFQPHLVRRVVARMRSPIGHHRPHPPSG